MKKIILALIFGTIGLAAASKAEAYFPYRSPAVSTPSGLANMFLAGNFYLWQDTTTGKVSGFFSSTGGLYHQFGVDVETVTARTWVRVGSSLSVGNFFFVGGSTVNITTPTYITILAADWITASTGAFGTGLFGELTAISTLTITVPTTTINGVTFYWPGVSPSSGAFFRVTDQGRIYHDGNIPYVHLTTEQGISGVKTFTSSMTINPSASSTILYLKYYGAGLATKGLALERQANGTNSGLAWIGYSNDALQETLFYFDHSMSRIAIGKTASDFGSGTIPSKLFVGGGSVTIHAGGLWVRDEVVGSSFIVRGGSITINGITLVISTAGATGQALKILGVSGNTLYLGWADDTGSGGAPGSGGAGYTSYVDNLNPVSISSRTLSSAVFTRLTAGTSEHIGLNGSSVTLLGTEKVLTRESTKTVTGFFVFDNGDSNDPILRVSSGGTVLLEITKSSFTIRTATVAINNLKLIFPGVRGSSGTFLTEDGNGNLYWSSYPVYGISTTTFVSKNGTNTITGANVFMGATIIRSSLTIQTPGADQAEVLMRLQNGNSGYNVDYLLRTMNEGSVPGIRFYYQGGTKAYLEMRGTAGTEYNNVNVPTFFSDNITMASATAYGTFTTTSPVYLADVQASSFTLKYGSFSVNGVEFVLSSGGTAGQALKILGTAGAKLLLGFAADMGGSGSGIASVSEDPNPQLGGNLDGNGKIIRNVIVDADSATVKSCIGFRDGNSLQVPNSTDTIAIFVSTRAGSGSKATIFAASSDTVVDLFNNTDWHVLASTFPDGKITTMTVTFPQRQSIKIVFFSSGTESPGIGVEKVVMNFNGDNGLIYNSRRIVNGIAATEVFASSVVFNSNSAQRSAKFFEINVHGNTSFTSEKVMTFKGVEEQTGSNVPYNIEGSATYRSSMPITTVDFMFTNQGANKFKTSGNKESGVIIYGKEY